MSEALHPAAPHHLPAFITAPGDTDILMVVMAIVLVGSVLYLHLQTLRNRRSVDQVSEQNHPISYQ